MKNISSFLLESIDKKSILNSQPDFAAFVDALIVSHDSIDDDTMNRLLLSTKLCKIIDEKTVEPIISEEASIKLKSELEKIKQLQKDYVTYLESELEKLKEKYGNTPLRSSNINAYNAYFEKCDELWNKYAAGIDNLLEELKTLANKYELHESLSIVESGEDSPSKKEPYKTINRILHLASRGDDKDKSAEEIINLIYTSLLELYPDYDKDNDKPNDGLLAKALLWMFNKDAKEGEPNNKLYLTLKNWVPDLLNTQRKIQSQIDSKFSSNSMALMNVASRAYEKTVALAKKVEQILK